MIPWNYKKNHEKISLMNLPKNVFEKKVIEPQVKLDKNRDLENGVDRYIAQIVLPTRFRMIWS